MPGPPIERERPKGTTAVTAAAAPGQASRCDAGGGIVYAAATHQGLPAAAVDQCRERLALGLSRGYR